MEAHVSVVQGSGERRRNRTIPFHPPPLGINFGRQRNPLRPSALGAMTASARRHRTGRTRRIAAGTLHSRCRKRRGGSQSAPLSISGPLRQRTQKLFEDLGRPSWTIRGRGLKQCGGLDQRPSPSAL